MAAEVSHAAAQAFAHLVGQWRLRRAFEPGIGTFTGTAVFSPVSAELLHYREDGELHLAGGHRGAAWREYRYVLAGAEIHVCFVEDGTTGRVLHRLQAAQVSTDVHLCVADTYTGRYDLGGLPGSFTVEMDVHGPAKDYRTHTVYTRPSLDRVLSEGY
ncbi:DUF6314 family protein [Pseudonocardia sp. CA-107938]|uniref:DUF6314 family protein n=1 Tax=Pseudonocardia sp. CA-107938 TaxID=3240021 RepID=UPI003D91CA4C